MISVIMSTHNRSKTLGRAIDSILNQTYSNYEFIICDDNSTDDTCEILNSYSIKFPNVKVITNDSNLGLQKSLNKCIRVSSGEYIARMDDDDYSYPDRLKVEMDFIKKNNLDFVGSNIGLFTERQNVYGIKYYPEFPTKGDLIKECCFAHPTILIKSNVLKESHGYSEKIEHLRVEDYELWLRLFLKGFKGGNVQDKLLLYTKDEKSVKNIKFIDRINSYKLKKEYFYNYHMPVRYFFYVISPLIKLLIPYKLRVMINSIKYSKKKEK